MSDTREIIYNSPSMGRVTLLRTDEPVWFRGTTLEALESELSRRAAKDARVAVFYLYATDFDAIAAELEGRAKYVAPVMTTRNGLVDPSILTDDQLINEWRRRFPASRLLVCHATDDQLRAECQRRELNCGYFEYEVTEARRDRDSARAEVARLTKERDDLKKTLFQMQNAAIDLAKRDSCTVRGVTFVGPARVVCRGNGCENTVMPGKPLCWQHGGDMVPASETGPGIVGVKVEKDTAHYVDPTDLLCEDV